MYFEWRQICYIHVMYLLIVQEGFCFLHRGRNSFLSSHLFDYSIYQNTYKLFTSTVQWRRYWIILTFCELFKYLYPLSVCMHLSGCAVLNMLVNVASINKWELWLGLTAATDGDLFLYCEDEASLREGAQKQRREDMEEGSGACWKKKKRASVRQIRTHGSFIKQKLNNVCWVITVIHSSRAKGSYTTHTLSLRWLLQLKY